MRHLQSWFLSWFFVALLAHQGLGQDDTLLTRRSDLVGREDEGTSSAPVDETFLRRAYSSIAVVGDYIYFDGGEISLNNTAQDKYAVNSTLAIDLTQPWSPEDVKFIETEYGNDTKQSLSGQALFVDKDEGTLYTWAGRTSNGETIRTQSELWRFNPDGKGSGEWTEPIFVSDGAMTSLQRTVGSATASTDDSVFIFGGLSTKDTMLEAMGYSRSWIDHSIGGGSWLEHDETPCSKSGQIYGGAAVYAPNITYTGLLFVLGGYEDPDDPDTGLSFETVHFMIPGTEDWLSQKTTGVIPEPRYDFCAVGVESYSDGAYEGPMLDIFVFGGYNAEQKTDFSTVHVLSIPSFQWQTAFQAIGYNHQRSQHACAVIGNRQMLSWGGRRMAGAENDADAWKTRDPFPQGIGIYDMSAFGWNDRCNPDARPYFQHTRIRDRYNARVMDDVEWSSDEVKKLLVGPFPWSPQPDQGKESSSSDSAQFGAIAGSLVGGLIGIPSLIAVWFFWRRRQRKARKASPTIARRTLDNELGSEGEIREAPPKPTVFEAIGSETIPRELQGRQLPAELRGTMAGPYEMLGDTWTR